jgi:dipeptidyl aminopeptidase/acylaminoacyl peptidase
MPTCRRPQSRSLSSPRPLLWCLCSIALACRSAPIDEAARASAPPKAAPIAPLEPHDFSVLDMLAMQRLSDPALSADGKRVVFTVRTTDMDKNGGRTDVWIADVPGGHARPLVAHEANDSSARFSPDGQHVTFLSTRSGSSQLWRVRLDGSNALQLTHLPLDVGAYVPFSDGRRYALTLEVYPQLATLEESAALDQALEKAPVKARLYDKLLFRHWDNWEDKKRSHVFVWSEGRAPIDLMRGWDSDCPTRPFGGAEEIAVAPDGTEIVFAAKREPADGSWQAAWSTDVDLWKVPSDGSAEPVCLTESNTAYDNHPCYSPDGKTLAWLAMARPGYEADRQRVVLLDRSTGKQRVLTEGWDRSPSGLAWSRDGARLLTTADDLGNHSLFSIDTATGVATALVSRGNSTAPAESPGGIVYLHDTLRAPAELYFLADGGLASEPLTALNAARVAAARMGSTEPFSFTGARGDTVHAWLVRPARFDPAKRYPVAFLIHGGPQGSFGDRFHYRWNPQAYAGAGFASIMVDFHGSTGYGQAFTDAIRGDWGGAPYEDLIKGLDHALATYPFLDGSRVAALGASYGGYMINWIAGQTDRFRCLVNHDGNLDERMAYFDTEELWFPEWEHGGVPWEAGSSYAKHNPIEHVGQWKTPMLVIHGAKDYRVVDTQGLSTFTALQRRGVPSKLLYFPDENHWVLKPRNSKLWHDTVLAWISQWTE